MTRKEIDQQYHSILKNIYSHRFKPALNEITRFVRYTTNSDFYYKLEAVEENYKTLLRYAMGGYPDPERPRILQGLFAQLLLIADDVRQTIITQESPYQRMQRNSLFARVGYANEAIIKKLEDLFSQRFVDNLIVETLPSKETSRISRSHSPAQMDQIFNIIWFSGRMNEEFAALVSRIMHSPQIEWHEKSVIVSALTISLLEYFDPQKFLILADIAEARENQVSQRGLTGLLLALMAYDNRLHFFPELIERLRKFSIDDTFIPEIELVMMQFMKARDTDRITREFEEEVLPEMKKMMPRIEDKLQLNDQSHEEELEGKNPGWKDMIEEVPGLLEKIEKFSRMQMDGGDVFLSTFRQLKRFDFFNRICNWFVPFHRDYLAILPSEALFDEINLRLIESLEKAFYICNSDKYSFALNFNAIPEQQRSMIVTNFEAEFAQMKEMASEEQLLDQSLANNSIFIQYIQDLYRFFKLFPSRSEFEDIFQIKPRLSELWFYKQFFMRPTFPEKTAVYHFEKEHYQDALESYEDLIVLNGPEGEYYEKIGYSFQKTGNFRKAIEAYKRAELFDNDHLWLFKKLGLCYLKTKDYTHALQYFRDALLLNPEDLGVQLQVGQCLIHLRDYEGAVHQYQQSRFYAPDSLKVLRPLAYCLFILGKTEQADEYYAVINSDISHSSPYDLMNAAHVNLCLGKLDDALKLYSQSFRLPASNVKELFDAFDEDRPNLLRNGITEEQLGLIRDSLLYKTE